MQNFCHINAEIQTAKAVFLSISSARPLKAPNYIPINRMFKKVFIGLAVFLVLRNLRRISSSENTVLKSSLLLIAHPDDESMFFSPFLYTNSPFILCLSNGNFAMEGAQRERELENLCKRRGWRLKIMEYVDNDDWNTISIARDLLDSCRSWSIRNVVTFDRSGVSGHKNHISCYHAASLLQSLCGDRPVLRFYFLKTSTIFEKYLFSFRRDSYSIPLYSAFGFSNMLFHQSQLRWFRYAYCLFSNYMHFNTFVSN